MRIGLCLTLVAGLGLLGCSDGGNPCDKQGIDCSGHGSCEVVDGQPRCSCEAGYGSTGTDCVIDYELTLLQINDRHSHWLGQLNCDYDPQAESDGTVGGAARWMSLVEQERAASEDLLLLDAGDFTMGTMLVAAEDSAGDLNTMRRLGFDAAALGNHEFDWGPDGLARMIAAAEAPLVPLLCSNIQFDPDDPADDALQALYGPAGEQGKSIHPHLLLERPSGVRIGLLGLVGLEAAAVANAAPVTFSRDMDALAARTQEVVDTLRDEQQADVVVLLAHVGVGGQPGDWGGETVELARRVSGIDAILSGHYHTFVEQGFEVACEREGADWTTLVLEAGKYGQAVGRWQLQRSQGERSASAELIPVDDALDSHTATREAVAGLVADVEQNYLGQHYPLLPEPGAFLTGDLLQPLTCGDCDLERHLFENNNLGYLLADAVAEATGAELVAISNGGDLRASLPRCADGCFDLADTFIAAPLGMGPDGLLGYPLVTFYMSWRALKLVLESTVVDQGFDNNDYMLNLAGVRIRYDSRNRGLFSAIERIETYDPLDESDPGTPIYDKSQPGEFLVDQDSLVRITTSLYIAGFLATFNLDPLDAQGEPWLDDQGEPDWPAMMDADGEGRLLKAWELLAGKLAAFDQAGLPHRYCDDEALNPYGPYWRRVCDINPGDEPDKPNPTGHTCP